MICVRIITHKLGEIIGGSQREDDLEKLSARAAEMHLPEESISWYLDLRCVRMYVGLCESVPFAVVVGGRIR